MVTTQGITLRQDWQGTGTTGQVPGVRTRDNAEQPLSSPAPALCDSFQPSRPAAPGTSSPRATSARPADDASTAPASQESGNRKPMLTSDGKVEVTLPKWVDNIDFHRVYATDREKMDLAIDLSRKNVENKTGGPFGAAVFDDTGHLVGVGMNRVMALGNSTAHAEMVAFQFAEKQTGVPRLGDDKHPYELFSSCEPCAMCLGGTLWSGVKRVVTAATGDDARAIGFDEGPVFPESWTYLADRGLQITRGFERDQAKAVLEKYAKEGGVIYGTGSRIPDIGVV